jgi:hypothetical protein
MGVADKSHRISPSVMTENNHVTVSSSFSFLHKKKRKQTKILCRKYRRINGKLRKIKQRQKNRRGAVSLQSGKQFQVTGRI